MAASYSGACFCGAVKVEATGEPAGMGYCHCRSCRSWSGGPVNAFTLWKPEAVKITAGRGNVATFAKTKMSERQYCKKCGGHLMTNHPTLGLVDVFAATLPRSPSRPAFMSTMPKPCCPCMTGCPSFAISRPSSAAPASRFRNSDRHAAQTGSAAPSGPSLDRHTTDICVMSVG